MPALRLMGRAWLVAGDDLTLPFAVGAGLRAAALGVLLAFALSFAADVSCPGVACPWLLDVLPGSCVVGYVAITVVLMTAAGLLQALVAMSSSKGTIMDPAPRHALQPLLLIFVLSTLAEIAVTVWAARSFLDRGLQCQASSPAAAAEGQRVLRGIVWLQIVAASTTVCGAVLTFDLAGSVDVHDAARISEYWEARCRVLCWLSPRDDSSSREVAVRSFASNLANVFAGLDLVPSDAVAAMLLLSLMPRPSCFVDSSLMASSAMEDSSGGSAATDVQMPPASTPTAAASVAGEPCPGLAAREDGAAMRRLELAVVFTPYASASYGWWLQVCVVFCLWCLRMASKRSCHAGAGAWHQSGWQPPSSSSGD